MPDLSLIFPDSSRSLPAKGQVRVLGIDLGTTNSTVAEIVWDARNKDSITARCLEIKQITTEGDYFHVLVPSVVALLNGKEIVGEGAKQLRARATEAGLEQNRNIFYDCKNDIGILRTYHKAAEGYREAAEIGGKVLKFLHDSAVRDGGAPYDRVVVTVPASFQAAQRRDTLHAAALAGMKLSGGDLLDEPVAAFLDYIISNKGSFSIPTGESKKLLVFDFGGGTCDVAVFQLESPAEGGRFRISPLAVSRYHRLGGGDIDAAILHEVLIPQIIKQNSLSEFELGFTDKKRAIESSFIGIAEALKVGLCNEITRLRKFGDSGKVDKSAVVKTQPGTYTCRLENGRELALKSPTLSAEQFEKLLLPFLDQDLLYARETEYRMTCSIFAPIQDALERSDLEAEDIDHCLLVGGSCLVPQVVDAVKGFFPKCKILTYDDAESIQTSVAKGAAYHALSLTLYQKTLIQPVCHDAISIRTQTGPIDLIPKGAELPYPSDGSYAKADGLAVPETSILKPVDLRVEVISRKDDCTLISGIYQIPGPVNKGDRLRLEYRYDENQVLDLRLRMADRRDAPDYSVRLENPLTNVVNPQAAKLRIEKSEEDLRTGKIPLDRQAEVIVKLADDYSEIRQHEKALEYLGRVLRSKNSPDAGILNRMGTLCGEMGDHGREEKFYREAGQASSWCGPWFNLALVQHKRGKHQDAKASIDKALQSDPEPPYRVLKAMIEGVLSDQAERDRQLKQALSEFGPLPSIDDWQLGWYLTAARMAKDGKGEEEALAEQRRRRPAGKGVAEGGTLPILEQTPRRI